MSTAVIPCLSHHCVVGEQRRVSNNSPLQFQKSTQRGTIFKSWNCTWAASSTAGPDLDNVILDFELMLWWEETLGNLANKRRYFACDRDLNPWGPEGGLWLAASKRDLNIPCLWVFMSHVILSPWMWAAGPIDSSWNQQHWSQSLWTRMSWFNSWPCSSRFPKKGKDRADHASLQVALETLLGSASPPATQLTASCLFPGSLCSFCESTTWSVLGLQALHSAGILKRKAV